MKLGRVLLIIAHPKVFISYFWEDNEHKEWVKLLADRLLSDDIEACVDQYDLTLGDRLPQFMEQSIADADYVLNICTPTYKSKYDNRKGRVGYEGHIISGELFNRGNEKKFIPVIRRGTAETAMSTYLSCKLGVDLSNDNQCENSYNDLLTTIYSVKHKLAVGNKPASVMNSIHMKHKDYSMKNEPLHILGIITDEVTVPKMDGTRGSALYKIPFRLSKRPSYLWNEIFVATWNNPPQFSSMHRPGIASVYEDKIILNGTTIEEVRDIHRETLLLCVDIANKRENAIIMEKERKKEQEEQRRNKHFSEVNDVAGEIKF